MTWLPLDSLTEWENTWVWLKVGDYDRSYVYYKPINVCKYPDGRVMYSDLDSPLNPEIHTIQVINAPAV